MQSFRLSVVIFLILSLLKTAGAASELDFSRVVTVLTKPVPATALYRNDKTLGATTGLLLPGGRYVVAPYSEVKEALFIEVVLPDGDSLSARFKTYDQFTELAFLELEHQIREKRKLTYTRRTPVPGERVYLVTRRGELEVYPGWVVRNPSPLRVHGYLREDYFKVFSPAVYSGPVFNARGEFCGFLVSLPSTVGKFEALVESGRTIRLAVERFLQEGRVTWAWLGVETVPISASLVRALGIPSRRGLLVTKVYPRSPAARAGLRAGRATKSVGNRIYQIGGDLILKVSGLPVERPEELFNLVLSKRPGETLELEILRRGKRRYIAIKLSRRPER
ncbi:S1C family serine protease [Thermosulfurimonas dismutans]|uniref:PDZ domain-containing protein n=1 Tax=Thermosulfurimonas dismutans TaxID=999894 RepID=A0A179D3S9_9BACT|nr:PDZ domain-containing protein [Thermosulfurimonas dismutans]OAQ20369.1 hypothetical protein TDIS_1564 [Thermosulfurimonas dismutans]